MPDNIQHEARDRWAVLSETSAGTPMGELLRRYWWPIAGASEFAEPGAKPVRLLGEDLVLYKDFGGHYGLFGSRPRFASSRIPRQAVHHSRDHEKLIAASPIRIWTPAFKAVRPRAPNFEQ